MLLAGIDGCKGGGLCLTMTSDGAITGHILATIENLMNLYPRPDKVMIDVPIGLPDRGARVCDKAARRRLGPGRGSSVFPAPIRQILAATSYIEACAIGEKAEGKKISKQTWGILPKIKEVDSFLRVDISRQSWINEVHPEVCFAEWNSGKPILDNKKTRAGKEQRASLIEGHFGAEVIEKVRINLCGGRFSRDDLYDAFAALWTCERLQQGRAISLAQASQFDSLGLLMEIQA
jgi:predicted RNase H-like nuclease